MITLNIGLAVDATPSIAAHVALEIVKANGFIVRRHKVVQSDTEPTLVVEVVNDRYAAPAVLRTADDLSQDCIAIYDGVKGHLLGPKAAEWGPFDPKRFITITGARLA